MSSHTIAYHPSEDRSSIDGFITNWPYVYQSLFYASFFLRTLPALYSTPPTLLIPYPYPSHSPRKKEQKQTAGSGGVMSSQTEGCSRTEGRDDIFTNGRL